MCSENHNTTFVWSSLCKRQHQMNGTQGTTTVTPSPVDCSSLLDLSLLHEWNLEKLLFVRSNSLFFFCIEIDGMKTPFYFCSSIDGYHVYLVVGHCNTVEKCLHMCSDYTCICIFCWVNITEYKRWFSVCMHSALLYNAKMPLWWFE